MECQSLYITETFFLSVYRGFCSFYCNIKDNNKCLSTFVYCSETNIVFKIEIYML